MIGTPATSRTLVRTRMHEASRQVTINAPHASQQNWMAKSGSEQVNFSLCDLTLQI